MERSSSKPDTVPTERGTGHLGQRVGQRILQWLGLSEATSQREEKDAVTQGSSSQVDNGTSEMDASTGDSLAGRIFDEVWVRHMKDTEGEAGRTEGRIFREFVVGPQAYPDPRMWGPDTDLPLTKDERYVQISRILDRVDREIGLGHQQRQ